MLSCSQLSFSYETRVSVRDVSFQVNAGELLALFGHNGSGKSTLLKMLGGSLPVTHGSILWNQASAIGRNGYLRRDIRRHVGVLFQSSSSDEKLSVIDNLIFSARLYGLSSAEAKRQADWVLHLASLTERAHEAVKKLSIGTRRRMELYRCFINRPTIILLDEPTAGLDIAEIGKFFNFLNQYRHETKALIVMASHHADELLFADNIAMMSKGAFIEMATPNEMLSRLDYLRCALLLDGDVHDVDTSILYDRIELADGGISAKIKSRDLDALLKSPLLRTVSIKSFSIERPSLADRYGDLVAHEALHA